jgi:hypothetical protein
LPASEAVLSGDNNNEDDCVESGDDYVANNGDVSGEQDVSSDSDDGLDKCLSRGREFINNYLKSLRKHQLQFDKCR